MTKVELEGKGRIVIPKQMRDELHLKPGQKLTVERRGFELVVKPAIDAKTFSRELAGCVQGSTLKPLEIKRIWRFHDRS